MNEMELSDELVAQWVAHEAAANGIVEKTPGGYMFYGDRNDYRIRFVAERVSRSDTIRLREGYELGYD